MLNLNAPNLTPPYNIREQSRGSDAILELPSFVDSVVTSSKHFRNLIETSDKPLAIICPESLINVGKDYLKEVLGDKPRTVQYRTERHERGTDELQLILSDPLNRKIKDEFFEGPEINKFVDHFYSQGKQGDGRLLYTIGMHSKDLRMLIGTSRTNCDLEENNSDLQLDPFSLKFRSFLRSDKASVIKVNALGPSGTNISQVALQYVKHLDIVKKSEIKVHDSGIEPLEYAKIAQGQLTKGTIPLHIECAVYYQLSDLYDAHKTEMVFADHFYFRLDEMQLATLNFEDLTHKGQLRIASHPSPQGLVSQLVRSGQATLVKAPSNAAAADMVLSGEVDCCITTETAKNIRGLTTLKKFGSPIMLFTIGCSVPWDEFRRDLA